MATAAKFLQPIPIFLAYLVPLDAYVVPKIENGGRCHGNQGAKNVKFTSKFTKFCSSVSCHIHF
jgi:hypothetical protein